MSYKWLLFDADNTLMDFDAAAKLALAMTFEHHELRLTEDNYKIYQRVNHQVWKEFEAGDIDAEQLRAKRFELLFDWLNIRPTDPYLFNQHYLNELSEHNSPYEGVEELLRTLKSKNYQLSIITNGLKEVQRPNYQRRGWDKIFDSIIVSDEIGIQKPHKAFFEFAHRSLNHNYTNDQILVIGDNLFSDIVGGRNFGFDTCWIDRGRENKSEIIPSYTIEHVLELPKILKR